MEKAGRVDGSRYSCRTRGPTKNEQRLGGRGEREEPDALTNIFISGRQEPLDIIMICDKTKRCTNDMINEHRHHYRRRSDSVHGVKDENNVASLTIRAAD